MEISLNTALIHQATEVIIQDTILIENWESFQNHLGYPDRDIVSLKRGFKNETTNSYTLISTILTRWVSFLGRKATIKELHCVLSEKCNLTTAAEKLKERFDPQGTSTDQSQSTASNVHLPTAQLQTAMFFRGLSEKSVDKLWSNICHELTLKLSQPQVNNLKFFAFSNDVINEVEYNAITNLENLLTTIGKRGAMQKTTILDYLCSDSVLVGIREYIDTNIVNLRKS